MLEKVGSHALALHLAVCLVDVKRANTECKKQNKTQNSWPCGCLVPRKLSGDSSGDFQEVGPKLLETTQETFSEHFTMSVKKRNRWEV